MYKILKLYLRKYFSDTFFLYRRDLEIKRV